MLIVRRALAFVLTCLLLSSLTAVSRAALPVIATLTESKTVNEGTDVNLVVTVNGTAPFTYQWRFNGSAIAGATASTYTLPVIRVASTGNYSCVITNAEGSVTTPDVLINVEPGSAPDAYYNPTGASFTVGGTLSLSAYFQGSSPMTYVWRKNSEVIPGATDYNFYKINATAADAGIYTVTATNFLGSATSGAITVTVNEPQTQPRSAYIYEYESTIYPGQGVGLYSSVSANGNVSYQWYKDNVAVAGATSWYYGFEAGGAGSTTYRLDVTDSSGTFSSNNLVIEVSPAAAPLTVDVPATLNLKNTEYLSLWCSVNGGSQPFTFQWYKDSVAIPGATNYYLQIPNVTVSDAGNYTVTVSNSAGSATSNSCSVSVDSGRAPIFTFVLGTVNAEIGAPFQIDAQASGTYPITYSWKKDNVTIPAASSYSLYISSAASSDSGTYTCTATNAFGTTTTAAITVAVSAGKPPVFVFQPSAISAKVGTPVQLAAYTAGNGVTYQWYKDNVAIPSGKHDSFYIQAVASSDQGTYKCIATNSNGSTTSSSATLTVEAATAPEIDNHPGSFSALPGYSYSLYVNSPNSNGYTYQWKLNGTNIPGATSNSYYINNAQPSHAGDYTCTVTNSAGSTTSKVGKVTVDTSVSRPVLRATPGSFTSGGNDYASISVQVAPGATVTWKKGGVTIPGANYDSLNLYPFKPSDAGTYTATVSLDGTSVTSPDIVVSLRYAGTAPVITTQPRSVTVIPGVWSSYMSAEARGEVPLTYTWYKDGVAMPNSNTSGFYLNQDATSEGTYHVVVSNAIGSVTSASATYTLYKSGTAPVITSIPGTVKTEQGGSTYISVQIRQPDFVTYKWYRDGVVDPNYTGEYIYASAGTYKVVVTNSVGSTTSSDIVVTELPVRLAPTITANPTSVSVAVGGTATFTVAASNATTYQWKHNGNPIAGATGTSFTLSPVTSNDAGSYSCVVGNADGTAPSAPAMLSIKANEKPAFTQHPASAAVNAGQSASFSASATGIPAPTYQWYKNGSPLAGQTGTTLTFGATSAADEGSYAMVASNAAGSTTSASATLTVYTQATSAPVFTTHPVSTSARLGGTVTLTVGVAGYPTPSLQWRRNGANIGGATSATLTLTNLQESQSGTYTVFASNAFGNATSQGAVVTVKSTEFASAYSGKWSNGDLWMLMIRHDNTAVFIAALLSRGEYILDENVKLGADGSFSAPAKAAIRLEGSTAQALKYEGGFSGKVVAGKLTGSIGGTNLTFSGDALPGTQTATLAGVHTSVVVGGSGATQYLAVSPDGTGMLLVLTDGKVAGGAATVATNGVVTVSNGTTTFQGTVNSSGAVSGTTKVGTTTYSVEAKPTSSQLAGQRLINVSTRGNAGAGDDNLIAGLVIGGTGNREVLIRAIGPGLSTWVEKPMANPQIQLFQGSKATLSNNDWGNASNRAQIEAASVATGAFPLTNGSTDAVILTSLAPGDYTAVISPASGTAGVALVEVYEVNGGPSATSRLVNLSTRGRVGSGADIMIVGFAVNGTSAKRVLVRGIGPGLKQWISGTVNDPVLTLFAGGTPIAQNDDWETGNDSAQIKAAFATAGAFNLAAGSTDSVLLLYLQPGAYTAQLSGKGAQSGNGLVEVYELKE